MNNRNTQAAFIVAPSKLASDLSSLTQRPVVFKSVPRVAINGRPLVSAWASEPSPYSRSKHRQGGAG